MPPSTHSSRGSERRARIQREGESVLNDSGWSERSSRPCLSTSHFFPLSSLSFSPSLYFVPFSHLYPYIHTSTMPPKHPRRSSNTPAMSAAIDILSGQETLQDPSLERTALGLVLSRLAVVQNPKSTLQLHEHQVDGIVAVLHALKEEELSCIGVLAAAGAGKTVMFTMLIPLLPLRGKADMVLILVKGDTLVNQAYDSIRDHLPVAYTVGIEKASRGPHKHDNM
jgi:hypothetical protein